jgi:4-hydroxy-4-methyl-2-oxoglutarate aldolase
MSLIIHEMPQPLLDENQLAPWRSVPTALISDELNRSGTADASIKPVRPGKAMVGQAMTVEAMAADNLAIHHAVSAAPAGIVLVIDAGGYRRNAVWGGILHRAAELRGLAGIVVDGCVRDVAELRASDLPCHAAGIVPAGPHKGWGGAINVPVQVGGCVVQPGDIIVGDDDGIAVVPFDRRADLLAACDRRKSAEEEIIRRLEAGETTVEVLGLAPGSS